MVGRTQLRECRDIQLQEHVRLGDILVQRGYVDQATVDSTLQMVQDAPIALPVGRQPAPPSLPQPQVPAPPLSPSGQLYVNPRRPEPPLPPARPHVDPPREMRLTQELSPEEIVSASPLFAQQQGRQSLFESEPSPPPLPSSERLQPSPEEAMSGGPPPLMDQDEAPTVVGAKAVRRREAEDEPTMANLDMSIDELNPFAGFEGGPPAGARDRSDDSLDIIMEPSKPWGGGPAPGDLLADRSHPAAHGDAQQKAPQGGMPELPMHSIDELDAFSDFFTAAEGDNLGDSRAVTIEKDMSDAASEEVQSAWSEASDAWGPGPGFDGGAAPAPSPAGDGFGDGFPDAYDSEETGGMGYVNFSNLPKNEKLINSEDVPPRAPVGAGAFPDDGAEHMPAPKAAPRKVVGAKPKKKGGFLGKLVKLLLGLIVLGGVGVGAYFGFSYILAQQAASSDTPPPGDGAPPESPADAPPEDAPSGQ
jgi:hypothetical protein